MRKSEKQTLHLHWPHIHLWPVLFRRIKQFWSCIFQRSTSSLHQFILVICVTETKIYWKKKNILIKIMFDTIYCAAFWWLLWFKFELSPFDHKLPNQLPIVHPCTNIIKFFDIIIKLPHDFLSQRKFTRANIDYFLNMCYNKLDAATQIRSIPPWQQLIGFSAGLSINSTVLPQMEFFW